MKGFLVIITLICIVGTVFCGLQAKEYIELGFNKYEVYVNTDSFFGQKNSYVGGDAYNYIINGTYFTAFSVLGVAFGLGAFISFSLAVFCIVKFYEIHQKDLMKAKDEELIEKIDKISTLLIS
ncbi:MAG: hypothetical protein GX638_04210 [Crenarchaeota archaeon]|nr:hypothetical protein [Thermoproteota archaeon]